MKTIKKYSASIIMFLIFEVVAITLWLTKDNLFYLVNFTYIGGFLAFGLFLYARQYQHARLVVQLGVGLYMLLYLGIMERENMQIEGFWYFLFLGVFEAATIHYAVAKIAGPFIFGRGWCGYACWTAMVLDLLPFKQPVHTITEGEERRRKFGFIRYITFSMALLFVGAFFLLHVKNMEQVMFVSFIAGNIIYYIAGIALAFALKDNRAFCKYICPVTVFLKIGSYFSIMRVKVDEEKCISCGKCKKVCPMEVDITDNSRHRKNGTECILCMKCIEECPKHAIKI